MNYFFVLIYKVSYGSSTLLGIFSNIEQAMKEKNNFKIGNSEHWIDIYHVPLDKLLDYDSKYLVE